jgi:hypothetical protein
VALLLLPASLSRLLLWISAFTLAHSITLALSYFGLLRPSPGITEPLIAFTVLVIGLENLWLARAGAAPARARALLIFVFGLIHGLGLSYQLSSLSGSPDLGRLLLFNLGVELGQLAVALPLWSLHGLLRSRAARPIATAASAAIALCGLYWPIERIGLV